MPFPSETYLNLMRTLGNLTPQEFEALYAQLEGFLSVQHKDDGSHSDVTADSAAIAGDATIGGAATVGGDLDVEGNITAQNGTADQSDLGAAVSTAADMNGLRMRKSMGDWAIGPTNTNHTGSLAVADLLNTSNTTRQVLTLKVTSAYGTPTTYELRPSVAAAIALDFGVYQAYLTANGALRSVNANLAHVGSIFEAGRTVAAGYYTDYVPAWTSTGTAVDIGNSTVVGRYTRVGNNITGHLSIVFGDTATFGGGTYRFSLPVASNAVANSVTEIGGCLIRDAGTAYYVGRARQVTTTTVEVILSDGGGTVGPTTPMTFVATDQIGIDFCYEAA